MTKIRVEYDKANSTIKNIKASNDIVTTTFSKNSKNVLSQIENMISDLKIKYFRTLNDYTNPKVERAERHKKKKKNYITRLEKVKDDLTRNSKNVNFNGNPSTVSADGDLDDDNGKTLELIKKIEDLLNAGIMDDETAEDVL